MTSKWKPPEVTRAKRFPISCHWVRWETGSERWKVCSRAHSQLAAQLWSAVGAHSLLFPLQLEFPRTCALWGGVLPGPAGWGQGIVLDTLARWWRWSLLSSLAIGPHGPVVPSSLWSSSICRDAILGFPPHPVHRTLFLSSDTLSLAWSPW